MPEKQRKTKDLSYRRALTPHCDPWCTHRTITRIAPYRILKESKPAAIYGPYYPEAERQVHDSQRWKARGPCNFSPRDCTSLQAVSRLPVTNHVCLGTWTVHISLKCHNLRPAPLRRCRAHLGLSSQCTWESKWLRPGRRMRGKGPPGTVSLPCTQEPEWLGPGKCMRHMAHLGMCPCGVP